MRLNLYCLIASTVVGSAQVAAQSSPAAARFDVVSIRPCDPSTAGGGRNTGGGPSPARFVAPCTPVAFLIEQAYVFGTGFRPSLSPLDGGPDWIRSDRYTIVATAEGPQSEATKRGPMLRALLEDRFKLKFHRETRQIAVYALTVASGGHKLRPLTTANGCVDYAEWTNGPPAVRKPPCTVNEFPRAGSADGQPMTWHGRNEGNRTFDGIVFLDDIDKVLGGNLDRPIINRTGIPGRFDVHLEYSPEGLSPRDGPAEAAARQAAAPPVVTPAPTAPSLFTAFQEQLGLKLEPTRGPWEFLVIDSIERPTEN